MIRSFPWIPAPASCLQLSVCTRWLGWLWKEALAPPSRQHRTTAPFCSPLFIRLHTGRGSLLVRTQMFLYLRHFQIFISSHFFRWFTFPLCISPVCAPDVYAMTLAQWKHCSPLDGSYFRGPLWRRITIISCLFSSFNNMQYYGNVLGEGCFFFFKKEAVPWQLKIWPRLFQTYCEHLRAGGELDWIEHRRHGE